MARTAVTPIVDRPQFSGIAEAAFIEAPDLPDAFVAGFEVRPGRYFFAYRPDMYSRTQAATVARVIVGSFVDITDEVTL